MDLIVVEEASYTVVEGAAKRPCLAAGGAVRLRYPANLPPNCFDQA